MIVIDKGRVLRQGTPSEIKQLGHTRVIRCRTTLSLAALRLLPGVVTAEQDSGRTTLAANHPEQLLRTLLAADTQVTELEVVIPALEDAFLALTRPHA